MDTSIFRTAYCDPKGVLIREVSLCLVPVFCVHIRGVSAIQGVWIREVPLYMYVCMFMYVYTAYTYVDMCVLYVRMHI